MATLNQWQQVYALARMAGVINGSVGQMDTLTSQLTEKLDTFYKKHTLAMGAWSTVWGPVVFENAHNQALQSDNAMYVAFNEAQKMYVVCIAGTNFKSDYDLKAEDYAVDTTKSWASAFKDTLSLENPPELSPCVSSGTALAVNILLGMKDGKTGATLLQYLTSLQSQPEASAAKLIFTGHSLGGALAPTLALALFNSHGGPLTKSKWDSVYFYTMAGPTPGNADFATYIGQEFSAQSTENDYQGWNQNVCNSIDAVPQSWVIALLTAMPELYPHSMPWPPDDLSADVQRKLALSTAGADAGAGPYTQIQNRILPGAFYKLIAVTDYTSYMKQLGYQHTMAYDKLFEVGLLAPSWNSK